MAMESSNDSKQPAGPEVKPPDDSGPGFLAARAVMEEFPCGCVAVDSAGLVVHANPPFVKLVGSTVARLKGRPLASLLTAAHRENFPDKLRSLFKKRGRARLTVEIARPGREALAVELACQPTLGRGFGRTLILAVAESRDAGLDTRLALEKQVAERTRALDAQIKERLRVEEALRESQERLTLALWGSNCVWWDLDLKEDRMQFSPRIREVFGSTVTDMRKFSENMAGFLHPEDYPKTTRAFLDHLEGRAPNFAALHRVRGHGGMWQWVAVHGRIVGRNARGRPLRLVGISQNVTDSIQAEQERDLIFQNTYDMIALMTMSGMFLTVNPAWERVLGWTPEEMACIPSIELTHPGDRERGTALLRNVYEGRAIEGFEQRVLCKNGDYRWLSCSVQPLTDRELFVVIARDITEAMAHQEELLRLNRDLEGRVAERTRELQEQVALLQDRERRLRHAENQLNDAMDLARIAYWDYDLETGEFLLNDRMYCLLRTTALQQGGYRLTPERVGELFVPKGVSVAPRRLVEQALDHANETGAVILDQELIFGDGTKGVMRIRVQAERDAEGRVTRLYGVHQDVTEARRIGEELARREALYRAIFETSHDGILVVDITSNRFAEMNTRALELLGRTEADLSSIGLLDIFHPDDLPRAAESLQRLLSENTRVPERFRVLRGDGVYVWVEGTATSATLNGHRMAFGTFRVVDGPFPE
ncbi:MAG: PAS domain S-box protein [Candidatus Hydrogenedens sp.]|nr:PAS domain S-box protein [Candidatus Hydrogenedentota bacterium]NLF57022.1 PAS domain S-box protein [Candidatus Hydrogenedens sp.]